jgi:hypothetical protein
MPKCIQYIFNCYHLLLHGLDFELSIMTLQQDCLLTADVIRKERFQCGVSDELDYM